MAKIKSLLETLDDLPEALHEYYVEKDGKFVLDLDGVDAHPSVIALKNAHERTKNERRTAMDELTKLRERLTKIPEDFDPEEFARIKATLAEYEADPNKKGGKDSPEAVAARKMLEQKITTMEKQFADEKVKFEKALATKDKFISSLLIDEGLTKALVDVGVNKNFFKAAKALLKNDCKVIEEDGDYKAVVETDLGQIDISKYVADWASSDEGKPFIPPATGGDATGGAVKTQKFSGEANPWSKDHWNLTAQGQMIRADRAKAEKMAKAHGHKLPGAVA